MRNQENKWILMLGLWLLTWGVQAQANVSLRCELNNCGGSLALYSFDGFSFRQIDRQSAAMAKLQVFEFSVPASAPRFYYVGPTAEDVRPVILGEDKQVVVKGSCSQMRVAAVSGSRMNQEYDVLKERIESLNTQSGQLLRSYAYAEDEAQKKSFQGQMKSVDTEKLGLLDSLQKANAFLYRVMTLNTYLSFPNNSGNYSSEIEYFANEFLRFPDFRDPGYDGLPWVYEVLSTYTQTLAGVGIADADMDTLLTTLLGRFTPGSSAQQLAYGGILAGLGQRKHDAYPKFAQQFLSLYEKKAPEAAADVRSALEKAMRLSVGTEAPDFSQATPEGTDMKLSSLRGKYVLIDFWASWCGPCRRENPNVVRLYNQYKEKGFEILGVSLDQSRDRWLQAIEADQLTWSHVSDLKGWGNEVAKMYEISSIPKTILLDPQGKIIAKDLRGPSLERMLAQLFN
ncbi:MAG: peroxiredoxin family protein [Haliscomenobacter sp.]